jgi:glyoxylase-like metal-dependent hydrolase (beta-lactamase superfamily II)
MNQWQIGKVKITRIVEIEINGGTRFILPDATRDACLPIDWMLPHFMDDKGNLIMSVHALVIDTGTRKIVVDTCIGNDKERSIQAWSNLQTDFLKDLEQAGYPPDTIDTVMCTHLHIDHVGWNTMLVDGEWVPTFKNARYLVAENEWKYWDATEEPGQAQVMSDSVQPVKNAGLMDLVNENHQLCDEVYLEPTPGHTPGHVSVHIHSEGQDALITGDCIHHPVQMTNPEWCSSADFDQKQGLLTRNELLEKYVDGETLIIGTHFATPTAGHIKKLSEGKYWFDVN